MTQGPGAPAKAKGAPVYARIITPPPGIRLAAVRPGQVCGAQGSPVTVVHSVSKVAEGQPQVMTVTTTAGQPQVEPAKDAANWACDVRMLGRLFAWVDSVHTLWPAPAVPDLMAHSG